MEVELRIKVESIEDYAQKLKSLNFQKVKDVNQLDEYFKFGLDAERRLVIRIRKMDGRTKLTFKGSSELSEDVAWQEWEGEIQDADVLKKLLLSNGLVDVVSINKKRSVYKFEDFEINLDIIENLGEFIEVELIADDAQEALGRIKSFLTEKLGISDLDIISKGYVPLMIEKQETN